MKKERRIIALIFDELKYELIIIDRIKVVLEVTDFYMFFDGCNFLTALSIK